MAANKFATMMHKNTNKITLVLVYAVLEWTLIVLLLLNSIFFVLVIKFSHFFSLKPPCLWCSTLHRFLKAQNINSHLDILCELHSKEVSILGFCPNHKKLAEIKGFCEDCFSSHLDFQSETKSSDEEDNHLKCSCCGLKFHNKSIDDLLLTRISSDVLEYTKNGNSVLGIEGNVGPNDQIGSDFVKENLEILMNCERKEDSASNFLPQDLEFFFDYSGNQLVPIELVDSTPEESQNISEADEECEYGDYQIAQVIQQPVLESVELEEAENSLVFHAKINDKYKSIIVEETRALFIHTSELKEKVVETDNFEADTHLVHEEAEVSLGSEIPVLDSCLEEPSTRLHDLHLSIENGFKSKNLSGNHNEVEEEKTLNTPGSIENLNQLDKKFLMMERKESGAEESFDDGAMRDMDGGDLINTIERLKSALKAERTALNALYGELEEERSAAAVAASETMAMINRLQEEKAAMKMEALQYQRMMEEQSEYDQEALQLLNELMTKREKELELYRKKVEDYEAGAMNMCTMCNRSGTFEFSETDRDGILIEMKDESNMFDHDQESCDLCTPGEAVLELESSLADFEEERLSIFKHIKILERQLFALSDDEDQDFADVRPIEDFDDENGELLVPVTDAINIEKVTESNGFHSENLGNGGNRNDIEEEVDRVYGRLQALEADREFLKHCIGSLKKGDKGMGLLQQILHHLRDLGTVDLHR